MKDQALTLRTLYAARPAAPPAGTPVWVVGGGKGGVGKSVIGVLLAAALARRGHRVLLHDAAHNQGNLHVLLGVHPRATPAELLEGDATIEDLTLSLSEQLTLLPAASGAENLQGLGTVDRARLQSRLATLYADFDVVVADAGPGIESALRLCAAAASGLLAVTTPEPAALTDTYALLKLVHARAPTLPTMLLVNRARDAEEARTAAEKLGSAVTRFLRREFTACAVLAERADVAAACRRPGTVLDLDPSALEPLADRCAPGSRPATVTRSCVAG